MIVLCLMVVLGPAGIVLRQLVTAYARALDVLPSTPQHTLDRAPVIGATQIYDSRGETLLFSVQDPLGDQRAWIPLKDLPELVGAATLLWEDPDFLETTGFDLIRTLRRLLSNLDRGPLEEDTSLTGRLVRNVLLPSPDFVTLQHHATEIALVAEINRRYSPEAVLEWHLNTNYYGNEAYGIEAAARVYLGKSARDLTLDEIALLAAIPTAPQFNPVDNETAARGRQSDMLRRLLAAGRITQAAFEQAINVYTPIRPDAGQTPLVAPEFARYARRQAETILSAYGMDGPQMVARGGLQITTTLDLDLYTQAECILRTHLARLAGETAPILTAEGGTCFGAVYLPPVAALAGSSLPDSGAVVILDAETGVIRAIVGGGTQAVYQPGVALHPFVYLNGLLNANYTPASMLLDVRLPFPGAAANLLYVPNNPDGQFRGPVSLRDAFGAGLLPPVAQVANVLNINDVLRETAAPMGINSLRGGIYDLTLLERGGAVSVLDVAYAYSVFAAMGKVSGLPVNPLAPGLRNHDPVAVLRIEDAAGSLLWSYDAAQIAAGRVNLLQEEAAYLVNDMLSDPAPKRLVLGERNVLELSRRAAVVNGLTGDQTGSWTVGYTPKIVTGAYLGRIDRTQTALRGFGVEGAAPVWRAIMDYAHDRDGIAGAEWPRPAGIIEVPVCEISGMSPNDACPTRTEIFLHAGQIPPVDTYWRLVEVNTQTNQITTANTPAALRATRAYFVPPDNALEWWQANNLPLPPTQYDTLSSPSIVSDAVILQPSHLEIVGGDVTIIGSINTSNMAYYQLSYGQGTSPTEWIALTGQETTFIPGVSLALWDTRTLDGTYALQLTVVMQDDTRVTAFNHVIVDNIPPAVVLVAGAAGQVFYWPEDSVIPLRAEATDNISLNRVEFYHNGQYVGTSESYPYGYEHPIERTGTELFAAVVFDAVGNSSQAEIQVEILAAGQ